jgi:hypothetical protein
MTTSLSKLRWSGLITYRTDEGRVSVEYFFDEISELHGIVERGPSFDAIVSIQIVRTNAPPGCFTIEETRAL